MREGRKELGGQERLGMCESEQESTQSYNLSLLPKVCS